MKFWMLEPPLLATMTSSWVMMTYVQKKCLFFFSFAAYCGKKLGAACSTSSIWTHTPYTTCSFSKIMNVKDLNKMKKKKEEEESETTMLSYSFSLLFLLLPLLTFQRSFFSSSSSTFLFLLLTYSRPFSPFLPILSLARFFFFSYLSGPSSLSSEVKICSLTSITPTFFCTRLVSIPFGKQKFASSGAIGFLEKAHQ